ncbi:MAG TPA: bifunctional [glutamate--ammonia ligase]-adenylyl-L-tyrosine phosphorylase/[glutamate--ammonia-ligase] adenylyltransferase, partial [Gammaproteobacteria bacterium]|nr:bifunctional [glutamate--ammonia ligase]-adenylyl-L-tyrosine phosphorylase/[glutamate--ammonia-ligase] adenylyltransferase [Gammaproteobacteria bacterium]
MKLTAPPDLPAALRARFDLVADLGEIDPGWSEDVAATAARVVTISDFVLGVLKRFPREIAARVADRAPLSRATLASSLDLSSRTEAEAMVDLRRVRQVELARIAWRDLAGFADLETTLAELSVLAEGLIGAAAGFAEAQLGKRLRAPRDAVGKPLPLLVLAMGKLGGGELNFSSDVDLVFLYPDAAVAASADAGDEPSEPEIYYVRVAQLLIKLLDQKTADGFVYRVDARLRPFGASGPLVVSISSFESYLVQHGRDWERYAYVKARLITGLELEHDVFDLVLTPFVYRRYLDYGVFDALRHMKTLIAKEVARKDMAENIKLGPGGIREIEFITQAFQLVRGGRHAELRSRSLLQALPRLAGDRQLPREAVERLVAAYRFLRALENRLQALEDRQTHELPEDDERRARLAYALGEKSWNELSARLRSLREWVEWEFERVAWDAEGRGAGRAGVEVVGTAWAEGAPGAALAGTPLENDAEIAALLAELRGGSLYQRMDEVARQRLAAVIGRTITLTRKLDAPKKALERVLPIYRAVCRRS